MKARFLAIGLALCFQTHSLSAAEGIVFFMNNFGGYLNGTAGWSFEPQTAISVTSLGCFDYMTQSPLTVGLWAPDGSLLASSVVTTNSSVVNLSRYESISPVILSPGLTYRVGAYSPSGTLIISAVVPAEGGVVTTSPGIQLGTAVANFGSFAFPGLIVGDPGAAIITANFQYTAVPEPSSLALLLVTATVTARRKNR